MKNDYSKFHKWLEKKGDSISFVCYESNMVGINRDTWWIDFGTNPCNEYLVEFTKPKEACEK